MDENIARRNIKNLKYVIDKEIKAGWRIYQGKLKRGIKIPNDLEVRIYDEYPNLVFVKNK